MRTTVRLTKALLDDIHGDLSRPHAYAHERVGFIACALSSSTKGLLILARDYMPVADSDYERDPTVGAMMSSTAIRKALEFAYNYPVSMFHVHRHDHRGRPEFSNVDVSEARKFVPDFWKVRPSVPHGLMVLSKNAATAAMWDPATKEPRYVDEINIVGRPLMSFWSRR